MRTIMPFWIALLAMFAVEYALADVDVRVGNGAGCATPSIQTAINDSVAANGVTDIKIARNATYSAQQLMINGRNIRLIGGYANCTQIEPDATRTLISGAGGAAASVIRVAGSTSTVGLQNLEIIAGDEPSGATGYGGGVDVSGGPHALLAIENTWLHDNVGGHGGGMSVRNTNSDRPDDVFVSLRANTRISSNHGAYGGGGLWCANATIDITGAGSSIDHNSTAAMIDGIVIAGPGGGIRAEDCAMNIATRNVDAAQGTIGHNIAGGDGGGLSATGGGSRIALYSQDAGRPTSIVSNNAQGFGGGIDVSAGALVHGYDLIVADNIGRSGGGGVVVSNDEQNELAQLRMTHLVDGAPADAGSHAGVAVECNAAERCNRISGNTAMGVNGIPKPGAAGLTRYAPYETGGGHVASIVLEGTEISRNDGESVLTTGAGPGGGQRKIKLEGALIVDNFASRTLMENISFFFIYTGSLRIATTTIAGNTIGGSDVILTHEDFSMHDSIVWQPGKRVVAPAEKSFTLENIDYVLASDLDSVPVSPHNFIADPRFVDPAVSNYRLRLDSPALDFAPSLLDDEGRLIAATVDDLPRLVDLGCVANEFGIQDLGAYERQFACADDTIFCNGFERACRFSPRAIVPSISRFSRR